MWMWLCESECYFICRSIFSFVYAVLFLFSLIIDISFIFFFLLYFAFDVVLTYFIHSQLSYKFVQCNEFHILYVIFSRCSCYLFSSFILILSVVQNVKIVASKWWLFSFVWKNESIMISNLSENWISQNHWKLIELSSTISNMIW